LLHARYVRIIQTLPESPARNFSPVHTLTQPCTVRGKNIRYERTEHKRLLNRNRTVIRDTSFPEGSRPKSVSFFFSLDDRSTTRSIHQVTRAARRYIGRTCNTPLLLPDCRPDNQEGIFFICPAPLDSFLPFPRRLPRVTELSSSFHVFTLPELLDDGAPFLS